VIGTAFFVIREAAESQAQASERAASSPSPADADCNRAWHEIETQN
jgi:hypothetical protein